MVRSAGRNRGAWLLTITTAAIYLAAATGSLPALGASKEDRIFTVGNYPVEARAADAVAAKERAIAEGQQAALRSLLKRLVPVTNYRRLAALKTVNAGELIESFAVRSERNSSTDYIASYDFVFSPEPVRQLLDREGIPYLDRQAPPVTIVPAYRVSQEAVARLPQTFADAPGSDAWLYAWKALDLANTLTPVSLQPLKRDLHRDTVRLLSEGNFSQLGTLNQAYQSETVVVAILEPDADLKKLRVLLVGRDAVQQIYLKKSYRLEGLDLSYTAELAAGISLAILEGRWKAINLRGEGDATASSRVTMTQPASGRFEQVGPSDGALLTIAIAFRSMEEWQDISRQLAHVPEVAGLEVLGLSARRARVSLSYPGGAQNLAVTLAQLGLILESTREGLVLTRR